MLRTSIIRCALLSLLMACFNFKASGQNKVFVKRGGFSLGVGYVHSFLNPDALNKKIRAYNSRYKLSGDDKMEEINSLSGFRFHFTSVAENHSLDWGITIKNRSTTANFKPSPGSEPIQGFRLGLGGIDIGYS